ncbi:MAG: hypothetical protein U9O87_08050 [Verrucomicrobiota bacterium]|nr:hypothetical protein [Verrucomicrobiota bacterium]
MSFTGQYSISLDSSGRLKFPSNILQDFLSFASGEVVIYFLSEGCLAVYPLEIWSKMREEELGNLKIVPQSIVARRRLRRGALTQNEKISKQGRITIPQQFRKMCKIYDTESVMMIGSEIGIEIWSEESWERELAIILEHDSEKSQNEMNQDLYSENHTQTMGGS